MTEGDGRDGLIIFDFDGVFNRNSSEAYREIYYETLRDIGVELSEEERESRINAKWGSKSSEIVRELVKEHPHLFPGAVRLYNQYSAEIFPELLKPVHGSSELLGRLVSKYSLALDTAADRPILIERVMPKLGIDPALFVEIITADELVNQAHAKPDPHTPRLLMKSHGFKPSETVMVGDSENDVLAAYHSGIEPIVVLTGNLDRRAAEALEVDYIIEDVTHLESALRELGRTGIRPSFAYQA